MSKLHLIGLIALVAASSAGCITTALPAAASPDESDAADPSLSVADRVLARLGYVRADYGNAVVDGVLVDPEEYEEQEELVEEAVTAAASLPISTATRSALGAVEAAVERRAPEKEVVAGIDTAIARVRDELWLELAAPEPTRLADGADLFATHCASCHGAQGEGPPPAMAALRPPPAALGSAAVSAGLSPRRVYEAVTFGVPETAMVGRADTLTEAERWALGFHVVGLATDAPTPAAATAVRTAVKALPRAGAKPATRFTFEELADLSNEALLASAPRGPAAAGALTDLRGRATSAAASSPLRQLRTLARAAVGSGGEAALGPLRNGWHTQRQLLVKVDRASAMRVDVALAALQGAPTETMRRTAAEELVEALSAMERAAP